MTRRLDNKTALVTGSTSNIGRQIAVAFGCEGAHVIVSGRDDARGQSVVTRIRDAGGKADYVHADLNGAAASRTLAQEAAGLLGGRIDILVNNAGIFPGTSTLATDEETFDRVYAVNVKSAFFLTQALVPAMIRDGGGTIINLGSWIARLAVPTGALYSSAKGAVETMTRAWAAEFGPHGIRVNAISPGVIQPEDWDPAAEYPGAVFMRSAPAGTPGHPDAIAAAAVYLASDQAAFVHGAVLDIDGGRVNVLTSSARSGEAELAGSGGHDE